MCSSMTDWQALNRVYGFTGTVVARLANLDRSPVLTWGSPVPFFGSLSRARIATVGINPSNREFVDALGNPLSGSARRLPTKQSLGLPAWSGATHSHLRTIVEECASYFSRNPYDQWFRVLDRVLAGTGQSFYDSDRPLCHLDLVPFTTSVKWGSIHARDRTELIQQSSDILGRYLRDSPIVLLVLNGRSVVGQFEDVSGVDLAAEVMPAWRLPRNRGEGVPGIAYRGSLSSWGGLDLGRAVSVVGFNHNLQSSYGVTGAVIDDIANWLAGRWHEVA
jgi:hypothetical protein